MTDVLITGLGAVTCYGRGVEALWGAMNSARPRRPDRVADPDGHMNLPLIHRIPDESDVDYEGLGPAAAIAVAAAREAIGDAGLDPGPLAGRVGVVLGSCMGEAASRERGRSAAPADGRRPMFDVATTVADRLGLCGPHLSVSNACAAGGFALSIAADLISSGEADVVLAGGADGYSRVAWACFDRLGAVDPVRCRPFDRQRQGTILSEGAAVLVLESRQHAEHRGAAAYAGFGGYGWSCDAYHLTAPEPSGRQLVRAMRDAIADGGVAGRVGCVIPHGTGTRLNDVAESQALRAVFGPAYQRIPLYSLKALIGHTGGASAALAAVAAARMLRERRMPPNVPLDEADPECEVYLPHTGATPLDDGAAALVNAYAFGGNNTSFVLTGAA